MNHYYKTPHRSSLVVQWLGLHRSTAGDTGSIPSGGTKIHVPPGMAKSNNDNKLGASLVAQ